MQEFVWIYNEQGGVKVTVGSECDHWELMKNVPDHLYDLTIRGYAHVDMKAKKVTLALSPCMSGELCFYPTQVVNRFVKEYKGFSILKGQLYCSR